MKLLKESWKSNKGTREDHYFLDKGRKNYYFGYNPKVIKGNKLKKILEILDIQ